MTTKRNETDAYTAICVNLVTTGRTSPPPAVAEGGRESVLTDSKWGFSPVQNGRPCTGRGAAGGRGQSREQSLNFGPCCCRQPPPLFPINEFQNRRLPPSAQLVSRRLLYSINFCKPRFNITHTRKLDDAEDVNSSFASTFALRVTTDLKNIDCHNYH